MAEHNVVTEIFYDGVWNRVPMLTRDRIKYRRGSTTFGNDTDPAEGSGTIDNTSGNYAPLSVKSGLYGKIGQNTPLRITADTSVRMTAEVSKWKPKRPIRGSAWTPVEIGGVLRRLGRGADPLLSPYTRAQLFAGPTDFWPLDDGRNATSGGNLIPAGAAAAKPVFSTVRPSFAGFDEARLPGGVAALPDFSGGGVLAATVRGTSTVSWRLELLIGFEAGGLAAVTGNGIRSFAWTTGGGITTWWCEHGSDYMIIWGRSPFIAGLPFGATLRGSSDARFDDGNVHHVVLECTQTNSTTMHYDAYIDGVLEDTADNGTGSIIGRPQLGPPLDWTANPDASPLVSTVGGVSWYSPKPATAASFSATGGWVGETAPDRFARLCLEEGITSTVVGTAAESVTMGPQQPVTLLDQFDEIAATDDGSIFETRSALGLTMRTGPSKLNQAVALRVSYLGQITPTLEPVYGDEGIRNDVSARNPFGASARVVQQTGPKNVQAPPTGVGRYTSGIDVNTSTVTGLGDAAGWRVNQGTYNGTWYAEVTVDLDAAPGLITAVNAVDIGDVLELADLPVEDTIANVRGLVIGIAEEYPPKRRLVTFYLIPEAPYRVGILSATTGETSAFSGHLEPDGSTTSGSILAGAASFSVATASGPLWTTVADDFPMDVMVGGQRVSISSISGGASPQTFTVQSAASGGLQVVYPVASGADVSYVYQPEILTL